jgi:hypothetical protein
MSHRRGVGKLVMFLLDLSLNEPQIHLRFELLVFLLLLNSLLSFLV